MHGSNMMALYAEPSALRLAEESRSAEFGICSVIDLIRRPRCLCMHGAQVLQSLCVHRMQLPLLDRCQGMVLPECRV